ncbi:probable RNA polymerase II nuclear localization protein SLC7A6OS [Leptidea sinapis]|uniref:Probable RNA polymerase II nuclear localization protein SLC7A6OS n=1 Tax=Leptidea sinapis TaxID=189913 RepID=A0A5E4Q4I0_9NEOP|nr:probable RNA polymerase II nuclear localization protein SLC7A6OS [Leptidea sinapis]VVC93179.1 unnamed protein product [Leptidea sinapis]
MSSTVLRVKRRLEDNPQDALILLCKRKKVDTEEISPSLFVFRGTVDSQENVCVKNILPKNDIKLKQNLNVKDVLNKARKKKKEISVQKRYEVVNSSRGLEDDFHLVDVHPTGLEMEEIMFTYDLYTSAVEEFDINMLDDLISIEHCESDLIMGTKKENGQQSSDEADDDDDSNDENNWRNDYPDSEKSSIDENDMVAAMNRCDLDDLSSDDGEDKIYDCPPDISQEDVKLYGAAYAKYKARVIAEESDVMDEKNLVHSRAMKDLDEESVDGYKDDSDDGFYYGQEEDSKQFCEQYGTVDEVYNPD